MRTGQLLIFSLILIVSGVAGEAQRDARGQAAVGVIGGTVVIAGAESSQVRRATVTLTGNAIVSSLTTTTDDDGRFTFSQLPAGEYRLQCTKVGFVRSYYGADTPYHGPGMPILLADGGHVTVTTLLTRGAVIGGTITNEKGRPVETSVQVFEYQYVDGVRRLRSVAVPNETTDDRGEFRVFGLPPGDYLVAATGRPGAWYESDASTIQPASRVPKQPVIYAPIYYPGTPDPAAAVPIHVGPGDERTGISFGIRPVATSTVEGSVVDDQGQPVSGAQVRALFRVEQPEDFAAQILARSSMTTNGTFTLSGLPPSNYVVVAQRNSAPPGKPAAMMWAMADVDNTATEVVNVQLVLRPGRTVTGRLTFDGGAAPSDLSTVKVGLQSAQDNFIKVSVIPTTLSPDGTFSLVGVVPGRYRVQVTPSVIKSQNVLWTLHSALVEGRDGIDTPFLVSGADETKDIVVKYAQQVTSLTGSVSGSGTIPIQALSIVVFSTDRLYWRSNSRRVSAVHPSTNGQFSIVGLPAGDYWVCGVLDFVSADLGNLDFLERLSKNASKFTLADGEKKELTLAVK